MSVLLSDLKSHNLMNLHTVRIVIDTEGVKFHIRYLTFTLDVEEDEDVCWFVAILHDLRTAILHI